MMTQVHVEPMQPPLIKGKYDGKSDKYFVKLELRGYPTSSILDLYKFNMALFDNEDPEEFCLYVFNLNMTLSMAGTLETGAKIQYLRTLVRGEALR